METSSGVAETATRRVVVSGTGLVCPAAASVPDLLTASGPRTDRDPAGSWFDPATYLGAYGWKYYTPATQYLLAATTLALADAGIDPRLSAPETMGVIIGTNFAAHAVVAGMDQVVISQGATELSPAEAPNFSVNIPASQVSMRWAMRAFNLSLTNPMVAGIESLLMLASALRRGRARLGVAGAVEQYPGDDVHPEASEGACCFTAELLPDVRRRDGVARAEVVGGFSRFLPAGRISIGPSADLDRAFDALVDAAGAGAMPYVSLGPSASSRQLDTVCAARFARAGIELVRHEYLGIGGEHFTVSALLQVAGLIAECGGGLVVATSPHGHIAAVLLRPVAL
jgi:3-oxoacyl-[acyl-carrier-protein] synthase II